MIVASPRGIATLIGASAGVCACTIIAPLDDIAKDRDGGSAGASGDASTSGGSSGVGGTTGGSSGVGGTTGGSSGVGANNTGGQATGGMSGGSGGDSSVPDGPSCTACGDAGCVDLQNDRNNCGACGYACAGTLGCSNGQCEQLVHELVVGAGRTCALLTDPDGTGSYPLKCWGATAKQFFRSPPPDPTVPSPVSGVERVRAMALGASRFCIIQPGGQTVSCWGDCIAECDPDVTATDAFTDTALSDGATEIAVADGVIDTRGGTCVVSPGGQVLCWGFSEMITDTVDRTAPFLVTTPSAVEVRGRSFTFCALTGAGQVLCWGDTGYGPLSYTTWGISAPDGGVAGASVPVQLEGGGTLTGIKSISVADFRSCAVTTAGDLYCWGDNQQGELGIGDNLPHVGAVRVDLTNVSQVSMAITNACAIANGGQLYCWGYYSYVGLGPDAIPDGGSYFTTPVAVTGINDALEVKVSNSHACVRRKNGQVSCWGNNGAGQLGDATTTTRYVPTPVVSLP